MAASHPGVSSPASPPDDEALTALRRGDPEAFAAVARRHERRLHLHCYRMLGSLDDADDLVQETFLRAWRARSTFEGRSSVATWLHRIATNLCLNALERQPRRVLPNQVAPPATDPQTPLAAPSDLPWLQPYPDRLLDSVADGTPPPDEVVVERETIELVFLAAIQLLPPRQRAALLLRDVLGWSASETASALDTSVASANSALQRARATLREHGPDRGWGRPGRGSGRPGRPPTSADPSRSERELLRRYVEAVEHRDFDGFARLLRDDVRLVMPPFPSWYEGRDRVVAFLRRFTDPASEFGGQVRILRTAANRQPALAFYLRRSGDPGYSPMSVLVLRIEDGAVAEIVSFPAEVFARFDLPPSL